MRINGVSYLKGDSLMKEINKNDPIYEMTQSNQRGWDRLADTHYRTYDIDKLIAGEPLLNEIILNEVGDVSDKSLIHLLCHIGTDTLSWALQGADVTGVDISHNALKYARKIAERMNIQANFIQSNILEVSEKINQKYDVVFASTGVLCWLPDIQDFAKSVRKLLKDDGFFYLFDGHPFRNVLEDESGSVSEERIQGSYFRKQVWRYENMGDYTDPELLVPINSYEWDWTLGEIVTAFCDAGMRIVFLHEFPQYFYSGYTPYDVEDNKIERYPCTFSLKASVL
jgi:SAM-dependent methyltransferase